MANNPGSKKPTHDTHGTPMKRTPGPGPKDAGKGAAGKDAQDRVAGGPERTPDSWEEEETRVKENDEDDED
jgi:hypothetical protein